MNDYIYNEAEENREAIVKSETDAPKCGDNGIIKRELAPARFAICAAAFAALFAALMFESLFRFKPLGINVPLSVLFMYASVFIAFGKKLDLRNKNNFALLPFIALHSLTFMFFNNGLLLFFNALALIALGCVQICLMTGMEAPEIFGGAFLKNIFTQLFYRPFSRIGALFASVFSSGDARRKRAVGGVLIGIAAGLPIIVIMLLLLTSADMIFGKMVEDIISWDTIWNSVLYVILFSAAFTLFGSALISSSGPAPVSVPRERRRARFNIISVYVIVSVLAAVLVIFSAIQVIYLAGFKALPYGFSYAEYARQGFFQLCGAAALTFAVLALCMRFTAHAEGGSRIGLNVIFTLLAFSVIMLLVSGFWRMALYEQEYLFTRLRLYTQAFMILLAVVTLFVIAKIWKRGVRIFKAVMYSASAALILLTFFNADAFIARTAAAHADGENGIDVEYLLTLSPDALPHYSEYITEEHLHHDEIKDVAEYFGKTGLGYENATQAQIAEYDEYSRQYYDADQKISGNADNFRRLVRNLSYNDLRSYNVMRAAAAKAIPADMLERLTEAAGEPSDIW